VGHEAPVADRANNVGPLALRELALQVALEQLLELAHRAAVQSLPKAREVIPRLGEFGFADGADDKLGVESLGMRHGGGLLTEGGSRYPTTAPESARKDPAFAGAGENGRNRRLSETHFDHLEWRAGARRKTQPRVRCYGGQKQAPVAFLAAARQFCGLNTNAARKCKRIAISTGRPCRDPAMRGSDYCLSHGGAAAAKRIRPYVRTQPGQQAELRRALKKKAEE
jgi:hypothetical protein